MTGHYWDYPMGSDSVPSHDLVNPDPGNNANFAVSWPDDVTIGSPYWRTVVGEFENSESPYGTFDQGGNICEQNETVIGSGRGLRGGAYCGGPGWGRAASRNWFDLTSEAGDIGFRVSEVPEPASALLLGIGGAVVAMKRRRAR